MATTAISFGLEKALARAAESYLTKVVGSRLAQGLLFHSRKLGNHSDDVIRSIERAGGHYDDILKLVDRYGETFVRQLDAEQLGRLGKLAGDGLAEALTTVIIKHIDNFADYSDDTIKKIMESGSNAEGGGFKVNWDGNIIN